MSSFFTKTTRLQSNSAATIGAPKYDQTYVYGQSTSTLRHSDTIQVPTVGSVNLPVPAAWSAVDHVTLINLGDSTGAAGSEIFVLLGDSGAAHTVGVSIIAPITGNASGGQISFDLTATAGQTHQVVASQITLSLPSAEAHPQLCEVFMVGH